jgi:hypothetical protein
MATLATIRTDTRFLLNDPATAANNLYSDAELLVAINRAYRQVTGVIRRHSPGYFQKLGYASSSTSSFQYSIPSDMVRLLRLRVDATGADLSANPGSNTAEIVQYVPTEVYHNYQSAGSGTRIWTGFHNAVLIAPAFSVAATNSIEFWYEYSPAALSADTNSPDFAEHYHDVLPPLAARFALISKNLDPSLMDQEANGILQQMIIDLKSIGTETQQFRTALHRDENYYATSGDGVSNQGTHGN